MFKKTIQFEGFDGTQKVRDFYFHLSRAELLAMAAEGDALVARFQRITDEKDMKAILHEFREIIKMACGVRTEDGERFVKTPEAQSQLLDSPAFDVLLWELCTKADAAVEFIQQLLPEKELQELVKQAEANKIAGTTDVQLPEKDVRPTWMKEGRSPTQQELMLMSNDELRQAFIQHGQKL